MRKIVEYKVISYVVFFNDGDSAIDEFNHIVMERIQEGRQPIGGVSDQEIPDIYGDVRRFTQAMVKYEEE